MADFWLALVIGLLLGGASGWFLRRRLQPSAHEAVGKTAEEDMLSEGQTALHDNAYKALEKELEALRTLIEEHEAERPDEALDRLDEAVKRANGRLKLLDQSLQRVQKTEKTQET